VLYEMLAGKPPFTGPTVESVVHQHLTVEPPPITNLRPTVPAAVAGTLARTLAKNPADRFNPAAQFVQALFSTPTEVQPANAAQRSRRKWLVTAAGVAAIILAAAIGTRALWNSGTTTAIERIAVLPLENQTGDSTQTFFADGMTRELIGVLTDAGVRVLGHRAVMAYRNTTLPAEQIARDLRVDAIVTGVVLKAGDVVQVAAELTDPRSGESLWARTFSRPATDVVTLQHEVASEIAQGIQARLTPEQERVLGAARPVNPKAYAQYLLGAEQLNLRSPEGYRRSVEYLTRSLALDSTFAPAWASLAMTHAIAIFFQMARPDSARNAVEQAAARAIALDDRLGDPLVARGLARFLVDWDFAGAEAEFRRARERNLSTQGQAVYSWFPWETGQFAEAIAVASRLIDLEPTTAQWYSDLGWDHWSAGDTAAARAAGLRAIALDSAFYEPYGLLAWIETVARNFPAARERLARAASAAGGDFWLRQTLEGFILAREGDTVGARRVLRSLDRDPRLAQRALLLQAIGETDSMYTMFGRAIDARDSDAIWILNAVPWLRPLRREPRYQQLLQRMGLPEHLRQ
jgi:TolB-like protein